MQSLQLANALLLLLIINRAFFGTQADTPVGEETIELAKATTCGNSFLPTRTIFPRNCLN
jgi:hypothetical protein